MPNKWNRPLYSDSCSGNNRDHHSFYAFDIPGGAVYSSTKLVSPVDSHGVISQNSTVPYAMYDYTGPIATLFSGSIAAYNDLGSGSFYGSRLFSATDNATTVSIFLNATALTDINAAAGTQFAFGAAINAVPIPAALWLLGSGFVGLLGLRKKFSK